MSVGRPPKDGVGRRQVSLSLREDYLRVLRELSGSKGCSLSDVVNKLLGWGLKARMEAKKEG